MRHYLAACTLFKNEAPFLDEWLRFHRGIGFDHFYLYDNQSTDDFRSVLAPWIAAGLVTLRDWPHPFPQLDIYRDCVARHWQESRWIAFIDVDEFLFSPETPHLPERLASYERHPGIGVNWAMYGSNGHIERPEGYVTLNYTRRAGFTLRVNQKQLLEPGGDPARLADYRPYCCIIKTIANPALVRGIWSPHGFRYADGALAVDENEEPIRSHFEDGLTARVSVRRLRINHYWSRSLADLRAKLERTQPIRIARYHPDTAFALERQLNGIEDRAVVSLAERILLAGRSASLPLPDLQPRNGPSA